MTSTELRPVSSSTGFARGWIPVLIAIAYFGVMMPYGSALILHYPDERHYAYGGARMVETGDWLIPETPQGEIHVKKPVLPYWFAAAGFEILGVSVAGFRLFWVIGACGILLLTYALARALGASRHIAVLAELFLAGNPLFLRGTVNSIPDIPLTLFMTIAAIGFVRLLANGERPPSTGAAWLAWIGIALAILSKGLLPLAFAVLALAWALRFDRRRLAGLLAPAPILVAAGLVLSWYALAALAYPREFVEQFFGDQIVDKVARDFWGPFVAFPGYLLIYVVAFWGWPFVLIFGFPRAIRSTSIASWPSPVKMLAVWALAVAVIFSLGGFVAGRYVLPVLPILAALLALAFGAVDGEKLSFLSRSSQWMLVPVWVAGLLLVLLGTAIELQLAPTAEAIALLAVGAGVWLGIAALGRRRPDLAPFLLSATPVVAVALLFAPVARLVLPDLGAPLAVRLAASGASPGEAIFVGDVHDASAIRLHLGKADAFHEVRALRGAEEARIVMTTERRIAETLEERGFDVEVVTAGWRRIDPQALARAFFAGRLAEGRRENADIAFFATCPGECRPPRRQGAAFQALPPG